MSHFFLAEIGDPVEVFRHARVDARVLSVGALVAPRNKTNDVEFVFPQGQQRSTRIALSTL